MSIWEVFGIGLLSAIVLFALMWAHSVNVRNYGFLDVTWTYSVGLLAVLFGILGSGNGLRRWLVTGVVVLWSARLGTYILRRVLRAHPKEDKRYETLRREWASDGMFLVFFELQAGVAALFSLPFLLMAFNPSAEISPVEIAGLALALIGIGGEAMADRQMQVFQRDPANKGKICQAGLWRYSRHPNYFFESLTWWGFFLTALGSPWGWTMVVCPLFMLWFLFRVTGIPLTEKHSLRSKGDLYREYQRTTSAFVPWFPKKKTHS